MKTRLLFALSGIALLVASCAKEQVFEPVNENPDLIPLNISGSIDQVATRATAEGFVNGDAVGLFAVNYSENNTIAGILAAEGNQADNVKYVFDEPNYKWVPVKPVYYKDVNTHVDLFLYYPYQGEVSDVSAANFEVKKDQSTAATATALSGYEASDWMWGKATDITPSESRVQIPLSHKLSAIQVTLNEGTGWDAGEFVAQAKGVIVTNTTRKATLNYATGEVIPVGNPQLDGIVMCPQTDGSFRAVVIPQTVDAGTSLFSITVNGISYSFTQNNPVTYQQSKQINVTININKKTPAGDFELELGDAQIVPWTEDQNTHGGEARQYFVVNVETPGTLGETIAAMGKNPAKIKNLKVTGTVNATDFYFMRDMEILEAINMKESQIVGEQSAKYDPNQPWATVNTEADAIPYRAFWEDRSLVYFVFPEHITKIATGAFNDSRLSGPLILPEGITELGNGAFVRTNISSISFPSTLITIEESCFYGCSSCSGTLLLPASLEYIGDSAFSNCSFSGPLSFPDELEYIGSSAFNESGSYTGNLVIPSKIKSIPTAAFRQSTFSGRLILNNAISFGWNSFTGCRFEGDLIIPEGTLEIPTTCFERNYFSTLVLPSTIKEIGEGAFEDNSRLQGEIIIPEGCTVIRNMAFYNCPNIQSLTISSTVQTIQKTAFANCYGIASIISDAIEPPAIQENAFAGVAKDNFTVEVPSQSVTRYQTDIGWSDFKRIAAHFDFSLSRKQMRALNGTMSRNFILRAPANYTWSIQELPDWVTVVPSSGTGKTNVTITVQEMARTNDTFEVNEGSFNYPSYKSYKGRSGQVIFKLDDKDYTFVFDIEQYDYDYPDGHVQTLHSASHGTGIDIVFTGDGYDARDIAKGKFTDNAEAGYGHLFDIEPYKTYKDYFNVYAVTALSDESGIGTVNTIIDTKFGSTFTQSRILLQSQDEVFNWAKKANATMDLSKSLVIMLQNTSTYEGITYMYTDGSALACCPISTHAYPYDFRGIVQHEAGGHGFGKLADEYIYHNAFIQNCFCNDGCEHPQGDDDMSTMFGVMKSLGWFKNLSMTSDATRVPWAHLIYNPQYSDYVDMFEGGYMHTRGVYRSEATSCMNNNIPHFSAISRQAIVERIMHCAGEEFSLEDFYAHDSNSVGTVTRSGGYYSQDFTFGVDPHLNHATGHGPILVGEHPNVK